MPEITSYMYIYTHCLNKYVTFTCLISNYFLLISVFNIKLFVLIMSKEKNFYDDCFSL